MNIDEFKRTLNYFTKDETSTGICVYAILGDSKTDSVLKLDVNVNDLYDLKRLFLDNIQSEIIDNDELSLLNLSSADERNNSLYLYDLEEPESFNCLNYVIDNDNIPLMNLKGNSLQSIKSLIIEIGNNENQLVLYKEIAPINIFTRKSFFLIKSNTRLEKINEEFLRISSDFQIMKVNDKIIVTNLNLLERRLGFHELIKKEATLGCSAIKNMNIVGNMESLEELISDIKYARKLTKIAKHSPVISAKISNKIIIRFCKNYPYLKGRIRFNDDNTKIILDTKVSKDLFIKVLMDDLLTSELTKYNYVSLAKDNIEE